MQNCLFDSIFARKKFWQKFNPITFFMKSEHHNFIGMYEDAMDTYACDWLIRMFEYNIEQAKPGIFVTNGNLKQDATAKSSMDLAISLDNYGHSIVNAVVMQSLALCVEEYKDVYPLLKSMSPWEAVPDYNIQRYLPGEGFRKQHCEHGTHNPYLIMASYHVCSGIPDSIYISGVRMVSR